MNRGYKIESFRNRDGLEWPAICNSTSFEVKIYYGRINTIGTFNFNKHNNRWWVIGSLLDNGSYEKNYIDGNLLDMITNAYKLLVKKEFNKYKDKMTLLYAKINLLRDNGDIIPDIAAYMKNLL